ncbi:hypothetical protein Pcinc_008436 [Petrolisthes cinctipes]|uniref:Fibronectin type-III domain-containing protein n=1 Tax=Petrolisthes cinctipes TaxID=88211 RepID=A0AAE1GD50_PETCI|nr:hypothetical protein Pcinc_008436 [Petrolisthes cinctipes]
MIVTSFARSLTRGKPDPPANCSVLNQTASGFTVACQEGFDGGLKQVFMLRVARPGTLGHNLTAGHPVFQVGQLEPDATYRLQVWAANEKGVSPSVHLQAFTTHPPTHQHTAHVVAEVREGSSGSDSNGSDGSGSDGGNGNDGNSGGLLGGNGSGGLRSLVLVVVGASAGVVLLLLLLALLVRHRVRRPSSPPNTPAKPPDSATSSGSSPPPILKPAPHTCSHRDMQVESENEVDPDLIPQSLAQAALSPSGPLLRPPASYGGTDPSFCEVVLAAGVGGKGGGAGAVHHHLLPTSHPLTHTNQHLIPTSTTVTNVTHHHIHHQDVLAGSPPLTTTTSPVTRQQLQQHLLPQQQQQHRFRQHAMKDPQFAHLDLEAGRQVSPEGGTNNSRCRGVPTVYATLDARHRHNPHPHAHQSPHVTFDLRPTHSQASLSSTHDLTFHPHDLGHQHDPSRPLLADDPTAAICTSSTSISAAGLVAKRESSV